MPNILCSGPGPHTPASGILGTSSAPTTGMLCPSAACQAATIAAGSTQAAQDANEAALQSRAQAALTANGTYLAIASPSNAQVSAQVQLLTKECNALIRLLLGQLDSTAGT